MLTPAFTRYRFFYLFVVLGGVLVAEDLPRASPFLPASTPGASAAGAAKYQLGGMITKGGEILVTITRVSDKQSFWIPVGGTVNEITVVSYNTSLDQVAIKADGQQFTLSLRTAVVVAGDGTSVASTAAAPMVSAPLPPPSGPPEVQEREARMLVTDLLDIGQQHRKAYEEAQKKAAADKAAGKR
ncbi:MAG: hypothetical protein JWM32_1380 [Verrucomicrobia bacterium]|nr:hypothetical protein [Verrucomicrobiota bacterium]